MGEFSITHWLVIAVIGIIFFGPKRLPQLGASLGESIRGFKKAMNEDSDKPQDQQQAQNQAPRQPELPLQDPVRNARPVEEKDPTSNS
jgi:sec-independent protein translocase protein TatA